MKPGRVWKRWQIRNNSISVLKNRAPTHTSWCSILFETMFQEDTNLWEAYQQALLYEPVLVSRSDDRDHHGT